MLAAVLATQGIVAIGTHRHFHGPVARGETVPELGHCHAAAGAAGGDACGVPGQSDPGLCHAHSGGSHPHRPPHEDDDCPICRHLAQPTFAATWILPAVQELVVVATGGETSPTPAVPSARRYLSRGPPFAAG